MGGLASWEAPGVFNWRPSPSSMEFPQGTRFDLLTCDWEASCHRKFKARLYRVVHLKMTSATSLGGGSYIFLIFATSTSPDVFFFQKQ